MTALADLERLRTLFDMLETREAMVRLLDATREGEGVQIYIGADNPLFGVAGCSMIVAPYSNSREQMVGAIGVIGPTRHQLCPDHSAGRLHRQGDRPASRMSGTTQ